MSTFFNRLSLPFRDLRQSDGRVTEWFLTQIFILFFTAQMHALALKDKEEEHAGLLHTAGEIQVLL